MDIELLPVKEANRIITTSMPQIHLSANDAEMVSMATQMVFHKMANGELFVEVFPHNEKMKYYQYDMFTFTEEAKRKLIDFLNNPKTY